MNADLRTRLDIILETQRDLQLSMQQLSSDCEQLDYDLRLEDRDIIIEPEEIQPTPIEAHELFQPATPTPTPLPNSPQIIQIPKPVWQEKQKPAKSKNKVDRGEWELNFGKIWFVRIGILLLLTGLVFLSTYAYKNWLFDAGSAAKVGFFMTISLSLTGVGMWLEKRKSDYRQYGRVLAAGGLAAGYYTIYASHFVPSLLLVHSPVLAGILLTLWAGIMLSFAAWKKSSIVAVMAIGLAFYGTIVNPSGWLSLFSALLLSSSGIWLMLRFNWVKLGIATMAAAYLSHAFWLGGWYPQQTSELVRVAYLASYWLLFTVALLLPQAKELPVKLQRFFCTMNNAAAWSLAVFLIPQFSPHQHIGWISIGVGALFIAIAKLTTSGKFWHRALATTWGYQGIMIVSLGILIEATGYTRFLVLAVEACGLLAGAKYFQPKLARIASGTLFTLALLTATASMNRGIVASWQSYAALAVVCAIYTALVVRDTEKCDNHDTRHLVPIFPAAATWLVLCIGVFYQLAPTTGIHGLWVTSIALLLGHFSRHKFNSIRGLKPLAQLSIFPAFTATAWFLANTHTFGLLSSILPIAGCATFWWMSPALANSWAMLANDPAINNGEKSDKTCPQSSPLEWIFGILLCTIVFATFSHFTNNLSYWMFYGGILALAGNAVSEYTSRRSIGVLTLGFHAIALGALFFSAMPFSGSSNAFLCWMPALLLLIHLAVSDLLWTRLRHPLLKPFLTLFFILAVGIRAFIYSQHPSYSLTIVALGIMAWAYYRNDRHCGIIGGIIPLTAASLFSIFTHGAQDWGHFLPVSAVFITHTALWLLSKNDSRWKTSRITLLISGTLTLVIVSSVHVLSAFNGSGLAICWALIASAFFCAGLILQYRPHRLIGLCWLAAAVLHVIFIDVMRMETLGRILSFFTLGFILLALGFLYNRYQEKIRNIL